MEHAPTFRQIEEQRRSGHEPAVLLRRSDDSIETGRLTEYYDQAGRRLAEVAMRDGRVGYKPLAELSLSDDTQEQLAAELGGPLLQSPEEQLARRRKQLFAFPESRGRDRFGNNLDTRLQVTDESLASADEVLRYAGADIRKFLFEYSKSYHDTHTTRKEVSELLRIDDTLRFQLGSYLLEKLDQLDYLPSRFYQPNQFKNPNHQGYEKMSSAEYAALLAISMLDATYKAPNSDPIESEYGEVLTGQHRYGAMRLLEVERTPWAQNQIKELK